MSNNILTETLLKISTMKNVEYLTYFNKTQLFDISDRVVLYKNLRAFDGFSTPIIWFSETM